MADVDDLFQLVEFVQSVGLFEATEHSAFGARGADILSPNLTELAVVTGSALLIRVEIFEICGTDLLVAVAKGHALTVIRVYYKFLSADGALRG